MKRIGLLLYLWICWGFALGAFVLLVPLRKTVDYGRANGWSANKENMVVLGYVLLLAIVSFVLARFSAVQMQKRRGQKSAVVFGVTPALCAGIALFLFMNPNIINADSSKLAHISKQFTIGPYPDADKLKQLKEDGYTGVISLLHPAVVPFEPKLLDKEINLAKEIGIAVVTIPMLPWISDNEGSIDSLRKLVRNSKGKYYVHCYLGKDRVNVARRIIEQEAAVALKTEEGLQHRSLDDLKSFERGQIYKLADNVYLTPMPTKEEYFGYVIATGFQNVVTLADLQDREGLVTLEEEKKWIDPYKIPHKIFDVNEDVPDARLASVVDSVKKLPRPILIHAYRTDQKIAQRFMALYGK